jgi:hypothetical protein
MRKPPHIIIADDESGSTGHELERKKVWRPGMTCISMSILSIFFIGIAEMMRGCSKLGSRDGAAHRFVDIERLGRDRSVVTSQDKNATQCRHYYAKQVNDGDELPLYRRYQIYLSRSY